MYTKISEGFRELSIEEQERVNGGCCLYKFFYCYKKPVIYYRPRPEPEAECIPNGDPEYIFDIERLPNGDPERYF